VELEEAADEGSGLRSSDSRARSQRKLPRKVVPNDVKAGRNKR